MNQRNLDFKQAARNTDPSSSHEAAAEISGTGKRAAQCQKVLQCVNESPGLTSREIAAKYSLDRHMVARRLPDLEKAMYVGKGPQHKCTVGRRQAVTWFPAGHAMVTSPNINVRYSSKTVIPDMTHPLASGWRQPSRERIFMDRDKAYMTADVFKQIFNYSASYPTGVYEGKMWRREQPDGWYLLWFEASPDKPDHCVTKFRKIIVVEASALQKSSPSPPQDNRLAMIAKIIEAVDERCLRADGPVTPTLQEMTQAEISQIYKLAKGE